MPTFKFRYENSGNHQNTFAKFKAKHVYSFASHHHHLLLQLSKIPTLCILLAALFDRWIGLIVATVPYIYIYIHTHIYISLFRFSKKKISLFHTFDFASLSDTIEISIKRSELSYQSIRYRLRERERDSKKERKRLNIWLKQPKTQSFASSFSLSDSSLLWEDGFWYWKRQRFCWFRTCQASWAWLQTRAQSWSIVNFLNNHFLVSHSFALFCSLILNS